MNLRSPTFGNSFSLNTGTTIKRSLDGELICDTHKNQLESFQVTFEAITEEDRDAFLDWIESSAGQLVTLTDHENLDWNGIVTNQEVTTRRTGRTCHYNCEFTFEGTRA